MLSGEENLTFFGRMYGLTGAALAARVAWALDFVGLTDRRHDRAGTYSGGMKRRLNLAAAVLHDPDLLLLDEPTVGVDPQSRNSLFENILALKRAGKTIVYTTHYMEEAARLCDRVAIVDRGKLLAQDTVPGLLAAHGARPVLVIEIARRRTPAGDRGSARRVEQRRLARRRHRLPRRARHARTSVPPPHRTHVERLTRGILPPVAAGRRQSVSSDARMLTIDLGWHAARLRS